MLLVLTNDLMTGIDTIDKQHLELLERANRLLDSEDSLPPEDEALKLLVYLSDYVHFHFAEEEKVMSAMKYEERQAHVGQHVYFIDRVDDLLTLARSKGYGHELSARLALLMSDWFVYHIKHSDKKLAAYLRSAS